MEIMARLANVALEELGALSLQASDGGLPISSTCVVFARSEVLAYLRGGAAKSDVLAGACAALCDRVQALLKRVGLEADFVVSGGIAKNIGVVKRLEQRLGFKANICFEPQIVGALGAAIFARELLEKRK
jgi:activator of 2-hydroxyglutaryl-CoA dehydratase